MNFGEFPVRTAIRDAIKVVNGHRGLRWANNNGTDHRVNGDWVLPPAEAQGLTTCASTHPIDQFLVYQGTGTQGLRDTHTRVAGQTGSGKSVWLMQSSLIGKTDRSESYRDGHRTVGCSAIDLASSDETGTRDDSDDLHGATAYGKNEACGSPSAGATAAPEGCPSGAAGRQNNQYRGRTNTMRTQTILWRMAAAVLATSILTVPSAFAASIGSNVGPEIPEPSSLALVGCGVVGAMLICRRRA